MKSVIVRYLGASSNIARKRMESITLDDDATLEDLLNILVAKYGGPMKNLFYERSGELKPLVILLVNGKPVEGLATQLNNNDEVALTPFIAGG